jgi:dsDNA-binding SOS-regulon protein
MINVLRKHSRWVWVVIAVLAIPFVFYFVQRPDYGSMRSNVYGKLYGRTVAQLEIDRGERMFDLARDLGMFEFLQDLIGAVQTERAAREHFALNLIILRHEAATLGIRPTPAEAANALSNLRAFRGETGFDINKYNSAVQNYLGPRGFTEAQMEELAADQVALNRLKEILGTGVSVSETESKKTFEQAYGKFEVSVVRFNKAEVANDVTISEDDIAKYYEAHKNQLKSDEKRRVQFVALRLTEEEKKLAGKQRIDALQKLADKATDVSQALSQKGADFSAVAVQFQLSVQNTDEFSQGSPDPQFKDNPQLAEAAFQLTPEEPTGEPLQSADGFYILHLAGATPAKPLTLDEAKPKVVDALKATRERELLNSRAAKVAHDLRETLKAGDPLAAAAQKLNVKPEKIPPFTLIDDLDKNPEAKPDQPDLPLIKQAVAELHPNEVTDPLPAGEGMLVAIVERRDPPDAPQQAERAQLEERLLRQKRMIVFHEWLRERRRVAGVVEQPAGS